MQTDSECNIIDYSNIGIHRLIWKKTCVPRYLLCQYIYQYSFKCTKTLKNLDHQKNDYLDIDVMKDCAMQ